jgi:hypothetical protein
MFRGFRRVAVVPRSIFSVRAKFPRQIRKFPFLDRPALAVIAAQKVVGGEDVGDAHVGAVVVDFFTGAESHDAEEHDFSEAGGVVERAGGFRFALGGVDPV